MQALNSVIYFIVLFLAVCMFVVILIAIANILTKSFKPRNSLILMSTLMVLFLFSVTLALTSLNDATKYFESSLSDTPNTSVPNTSIEGF